MKLTFRQFNALSNLSEDQVTEEKLEEIFGAFFGGKSATDKAKTVADLKAKKANVQQRLTTNTAALANNKKAIDKNKQWMDFVAQSKADDEAVKKGKPTSAQHAAVSANKQGAGRAADFDYAMGK